MEFNISTTVISGDQIQTVNAREVHANLEVGKDFSNWMKAQIKRARLIENRDFVKVAKKGELSATGQTTIDYHLTTESAKHIGMMSGTDKGFEVREYFLECERRAKAPIDLMAGLPPEQRALITLMIQSAEIKATQEKHSADLLQLQESVAVIEARAQPENKHFTVMGYSNLIGRPLDTKTASQLGRQCATLSRDQGMIIGNVSDPRFGRVYSYHLSILESVMGEQVRH